MFCVKLFFLPQSMKTSSFGEANLQVFQTQGLSAGPRWLSAGTIASLLRGTLVSRWISLASIYIGTEALLGSRRRLALSVIACIIGDAR